MNTLLLNEAEIKSLLTMKDIIEIVDKTFVDLGEEKTLNPTKLNLNLGDSQPTNLPYKASLNAMPAYIGWQDLAGLKWAGGFGLGRRQMGLPFINALIMLIDPNYGNFLSVMDGSWITNMRTGAQSAVILRYILKEKKNLTVGLYGAGIQGHTQTMALASAFHVDKLIVYDPNPAQAERFKRDMADTVQGEIVIAKDPREATESDAFVSVTPAEDAFIKGEWFKKGQVYCSLGSYRECDDACILSADKVIVDHVGQCLHRGNLKTVVDKGLFGEENIYGTISELAVGKIKLEHPENEKTLVVPIGMGCLDVAVACVAYRKAVGMSIGSEYVFDKR